MKNTTEKKDRYIPENDREEFLGQIIDVFEDYLNEKEIYVPDNEPEEDDLTEDKTAHIYGSDYDSLEASIKKIMTHWEIFPKEE